MIRSWREAWAAGTGQEELLKAPFGFVQVSTDFATLCTVHVLLVPGEATLVYFNEAKARRENNTRLQPKHTRENNSL